MIYLAADGALLTVMFFLYNACVLPLKTDVLWTYSNSEQQAGDLRDESDSHVLQCAQLTSISNHSSTAAHVIGHTFTSQKPTGYKFRGLKAEMRLSTVVGLVNVLLFVCCVYVLQGCPSALCLVWRRHFLWQANHDQLGSPAHKEAKSRRL